MRGCPPWLYPVLIPVSGSYPEAEGRLLTCYSPVRRSSTPEGAFPLDLHVLSTPPAFVLSQDQTLHQGHTTPPCNSKAMPNLILRNESQQPHPQRGVYCLKEIPAPHTPKAKGWSVPGTVTPPPTRAGCCY